MSKDWVNDVSDFHIKVMRDVVIQVPHLVDSRLRRLQANLIEEEIVETLIAMDKNDLVEIADGIVDSIVVLLGAAYTYGIDIRPIWDEVHRTNMAKAGGRFREDGKLLKPEGWKPPDIESLIADQMSFGTVSK